MCLETGFPVDHELLDGIDEVRILFGAVDGAMYNGMLRIWLVSGGHSPLQCIGTGGQRKAHAMAQIFAVRTECSPHAKDFSAGFIVSEHLFDGRTPARQFADRQAALQICSRG